MFLPHNDFLPFLTFHNVKKLEVGAQKETQGLPGNEEQKKTKKTNTQKKTKTNTNKTSKKDTGGGGNNLVRVFLVKTSPATFSQKHGLCPFRFTC